jgi:phosphoglycolate phosphatase
MALAFDYDGVLVDVREDNIAVINAFAAKYGFEPITMQQYNSSLQYNFYDYWQMLLGEKAQAFFEDLHALPREPARLLPGMQKILTAHKPIIISSNVTYLIQTTLKAHDINLEVYGGDIEKSKVVKLSKYKAEPDVFVTDTAGDVKEGKEAGYIVIAVSWGFNTLEQLEASQPHKIVHTPQELHEALLLYKPLEQEIELFR